MKPLEPPDSIHLEAAQGWLELGNHIEANAELEKITPQLRVHPDVLELRWQVFAKAQHWDACLHVADAIIQLAPGRASGWITKSIALYRMKRCEEAWSTLLPVAERFPHVPAVAYDLACYACQMRRLVEARQWLERAFEMAEQVGNKGRTRLMARAVAAMYEREYPEAMKCLATDLEEVLTALRFPESHRKRIRTTNLLERLFGEGQRRAKVIPRFMSERSGLSLMFAVLVDASAGWRRVRITPTISGELDALMTDSNAKLGVGLAA